MKELEEIRSRWEAATPGPWKAEHVASDEDGWLYADITHDLDFKDGRVWRDQHLGIVDLDEGDAEFIAHAPTDVARLLVAVEVALGLHKEGGHEGATYCEHCAGPYGEEVPYPCPTVQAIATALGGSL